MEEGGEIICSAKEEKEVMDTPKRSKNTQIATSIGKFEESPVFNFLNNLSPIKPVKPMHISQTINPLSFTTLPAVFASPHVSSLRESRFLRRHQLSDPSKPEFSSDEGMAVDKSSEPTKKLDEQKENLDPRASEFEKNVVEFGENFNYDCNSPNSNLRSSSYLKTKHMAEYACNPSRFVPFGEEGSQRGIYVSEVNQEGITQIDPNKEPSSCDWESLISDASDLLVFESPNDYKKPIDQGSSLCENDMQKNLDAFAPNEQTGEGNEQENLSTQPGDGSEMMVNFETNDMIDASLLNDPSEKMDSENLSGLYRGMRRRCLVFDMSGARSKHFDDMQSDANVPTQDQQLVLEKTGNDSTRCVLSGIGLHLNALATTPKDYKIANHEASASGRLQISTTPSSSVNFQPQTTNQDFSNNNLAIVAFSEQQIETFENCVLPPMEDACQVSGYIANEEINQSSSPKKKKRRLEQGVEGESSCKRCNCKKSKCLKLYCECFAAGVYCVEPCACMDCFNKPIHEDTVLATRKQIESRNPLAFAPKVVRGSDSLSETGDDSSKTPASARHKRGCNCKKSGCLKKYCECYQGGVGCSINCRCEGCKNAFGRKDGSGVIGTELEFGEDETTTENPLNLNTESVPPATPLRAVRQSVQRPFSSKKKPPRSSFPSIGSSSSVFYDSSQSYGKQSSFQPPPPPKFVEHFETIGEDEIPEFLQCVSPISGIKMSSPNQKRVSPPHGVGMSPGGLRSSRKLILQSIPSFPSLTPNQ
ncbi:hypothetical protein RD792_010031 [Penstemon davidsonii]|uniref:CRC domain-containing protein n=1 Tax=Penstemon davidsonii TaxID=160366 RepID=A0ABR0D0P8_9LAMI|nr:hypothetical protein RD792_010031 [Penstemon davidsonii]